MGDIMQERKIIAVVTANIEDIYQQRILEGVTSQCAKYGYHVMVISTLVYINHYDKRYLAAEKKIYDVLNFEKVDGIIMVSITLSDNGTTDIFPLLLERFERECNKKVVSLDLDFGNYETVYTDDHQAFYEISAHIFEKHQCKKVYFLTGIKGHRVATERLGGFLDYLKDHGMDTDEFPVFYGDFWYGSGEQLADDIHEGRLELPDAVICGSDHMAIGLVNRLKEYGISVPEQVIVTGYDATQEATINDVSIATYEPKIREAAAEAVNRIHAVIEPEKPLMETDSFFETGFISADSCGCPADVRYMKQKLKNSLFNVQQNQLHIEEDWERPFDISKLLDSYMNEQIINTGSYKECLRLIHKFATMIRPFEEFYLCLRDDWLEIKTEAKADLPKIMQVVLHVHGSPYAEDSWNEEDALSGRKFAWDEMFPYFNETKEAKVFYFTPVHFDDELLGYAVLQCDLKQKHKPDYVFRNWIRNVNNSLAMTRIREQLLNLSIRDMATGLYNRRGMYQFLNERKSQYGVTQILVVMADMDGLKYINDNFGHNEGDYGLAVIAETIRQGLGYNEVAVRNGGDEFLLVGIGKYQAGQVDKKLTKIEQELKSRNTGEKPYEISASLGYCIADWNQDTNVETLISLADERMYEQKKIHKKQRVV